jgi:hypothetical protein
VGSATNRQRPTSALPSPKSVARSPRRKQVGANHVAVYLVRFEEVAGLLSAAAHIARRTRWPSRPTTRPTSPERR